MNDHARQLLEGESPLPIALIVMAVAWALAKAVIYIRALHEDEDP